MLSTSPHKEGLYPALVLEDSRSLVDGPGNNPLRNGGRVGQPANVGLEHKNAF